MSDIATRIPEAIRIASPPAEGAENSSAQLNSPLVQGAGFRRKATRVPSIEITPRSMAGPKSTCFPPPRGATTRVWCVLRETNFDPSREKKASPGNTSDAPPTSARVSVAMERTDVPLPIRTCFWSGAT